MQKTTCAQLPKCPLTPSHPDLFQDFLQKQGVKFTGKLKLAGIL
jgi:hypothetical protein